jgi:hypothetical protein
MINSSNGQAFRKVGSLMRDYLLQGLAKPAATPAITVNPSQLTAWAGFYEPCNPRQGATRFWHRLGIVDVRAGDGSLRAKPLFGFKKLKFVPTGHDQFRPKSAQIADTVFMRDEDGSRLMVVHGSVFREVPRAIVWAQTIFGSLSLALLASMIPFAFWWIPWSILRKKITPPWFSFWVWPLIAALSLAGMASFQFRGDILGVSRMGNLTVYSGFLFFLTLLFPAASVVALLSSLLFQRTGAGRVLRGYSLLCSCAACLIAAYLGYWGILGLRTWR